LKYALRRNAIFPRKRAEGFTIHMALSNLLVALLGSGSRGKILLVVDQEEEKLYRVM
jgi:hypothetical protein